jgi:hypothetical protein
MNKAMDPELLLRAARIHRLDEDGPELLLPEILSLLLGQPLVWVPFHASRAVSYWLQALGTRVEQGNVRTGQHRPLMAPTGITALYFGVPTIVNDQALFGAPLWNKERARQRARELTEEAVACGATLIVSGLGSGDVSLAERISDMGGGEMVAYKKFAEFEDWVVARWL